MAISCPARMKSDADPEQRRRSPCERLRRIEFEEVADRAEVAFGGGAANRADQSRAPARASPRQPTRPTTPRTARRGNQDQWRRPSIRRRCSPRASSKRSGRGRADVRRRRSLLQSARAGRSRGRAQSVRPNRQRAAPGRPSAGAIRWERRCGRRRVAGTQPAEAAWTSEASDTIRWPACLTTRRRSSRNG